MYADSSLKTLALWNKGNDEEGKDGGVFMLMESTEICKSSVVERREVVSRSDLKVLPSLR